MDQPIPQQARIYPISDFSIPKRNEVILRVVDEDEKCFIGLTPNDSKVLVKKNEICNFGNVIVGDHVIAQFSNCPITGQVMYHLSRRLTDAHVVMYKRSNLFPSGFVSIRGFNNKILQ